MIMQDADMPCTCDVTRRHHRILERRTPSMGRPSEPWLSAAAVQPEVHVPCEGARQHWWLRPSRRARDGHHRGGHRTHLPCSNEAADCFTTPRPLVAGSHRLLRIDGHDRAPEHDRTLASDSSPCQSMARTGPNVSPEIHSLFSSSRGTRHQRSPIPADWPRCE